MKDHVGNVRVVYGDYRIDEFSDGNKKNDKIVYSGFTDYYPYGLAMDNRQYQGESYLFGFQGMEQEPDQDEKQYHTLFRQYDAVLGRWWSNDPLQSMYSSYSPYTAIAANPANFIDPLGLTQTDPNEHLPPGEEVGEMRTHEGSNFRWDGEKWQNSTGEVVVEGDYIGGGGEYMTVAEEYVPYIYDDGYGKDKNGNAVRWGSKPRLGYPTIGYDHWRISSYSLPAAS